MRQLKATDYYLPGYIMVFIMTNGLIGVSSTVSEFRRNGVIKLLATANVRKTTWVSSFMITQTLTAALLTAIMLFIG